MRMFESPFFKILRSCQPAGKSSVSRFEWQTVDLNKYPNVKRWYLAIAARPAVQKGYHVPKKVQDIPMPA